MNISQLLSVLDAAGIDPRDYRLVDDWPDDGLHLVRDGDRWEIHCRERGQRFDLEVYESEDEACANL